MAKQWATRLVVTFQTVCWFTAILLLLYRGVTNLRADRRHSLGIGLVVVASLMIVASPAIVLARLYDRRRYQTVNRQDRVDLELPPQYEDIVSRAPSYSVLFGDGASDNRPQEITTTSI